MKREKFTKRTLISLIVTGVLMVGSIIPAIVVPYNRATITRVYTLYTWMDEQVTVAGHAPFNVTRFMRNTMIQLLITPLGDHFLWMPEVSIVQDMTDAGLPIYNQDGTPRMVPGPFLRQQEYETLLGANGQPVLGADGQPIKYRPIIRSLRPVVKVQDDFGRVVFVDVRVPLRDADGNIIYAIDPETGEYIMVPVPGDDSDDPEMQRLPVYVFADNTMRDREFNERLRMAIFNYPFLPPLPTVPPAKLLGEMIIPFRLHLYRYGDFFIPDLNNHDLVFGELGEWINPHFFYVKSLHRGLEGTPAQIRYLERFEGLYDRINFRAEAFPDETTGQPMQVFSYWPALCPTHNRPLLASFQDSFYSTDFRVVGGEVIHLNNEARYVRLGGGLFSLADPLTGEIPRFEGTPAFRYGRLHHDPAWAGWLTHYGAPTMLNFRASLFTPVFPLNVRRSMMTTTFFAHEPLRASQGRELTRILRELFSPERIACLRGLCDHAADDPGCHRLVRE